MDNESAEKPMYPIDEPVPGPRRRTQRPARREMPHDTPGYYHEDWEDVPADDEGTFPPEFAGYVAPVFGETAYTDDDEAVYDDTPPPWYGPPAPHIAETDDDLPRWTRRRVIYLLIALVILAALVTYVFLPAVEIWLTPGPPPNLPPAARV